MDIEVKYEQRKEKRKAFVQAVSEILGVQAEYLGAPLFEYKIGVYTVNKDGNLIIPDTTDIQENTRLISLLKEKGYTALNLLEIPLEEPSVETEEPPLKKSIDDTEKIDEDEQIGFSIGMPSSEISDKPFSEDTLCKFNTLVKSKQPLFQKALMTTRELSTKYEDESLWFDWFDRMPDNEHLDLYTEFIKILYRFVENSKRINKTTAVIDNEKFAMRTFLNRIGMSGAEYKKHRKMLMKNLSGNSAFRYGRPDMEVNEINAEDEP